MTGVSRTPRSERALIACTTTLLLAGVLPQYLLGSLAVELRGDFAFSDTQLGVAVAASFALSALIAPFAGRTAAWIGVRRGVLLAAGLTVVGSAGIATVAHSSDAVIALMAVNGIAGGVGSPSFSALLAGEVNIGAQGAAFGLLTSAPQFAAFASGLALPLVAQPLDWRVAFVVPAILAVASVIGLVKLGLPALPIRTGEPNASRERPARWVRAIAVAAALASAGGLGMRSFLVVFAISIGFADSAAGLLLGATGLVAIFSRIGFGVLANRGRALNQAAWLMGSSAIGFLLMAAGGDIPVVAGALIAGGIGWGWQAPLSVAVVSRNREATAAAVGIQMAGFFAGAVAGPLGVGLFADPGS
jgi:MFS family permease